MSASPGIIVLVVLLVLATVAVVMALTVWLARTLRRAPTPPAAPLRPDVSVVLAHGLLGFDEMRMAGQRYEYFRGVSGHLQALGAEVHCPRVPPVASIEARAAELAQYVEQLPGEQIHVIAHSLGGLDARYALARLGLARRVASLTTVGTPHRGTPLADLGSGMLETVGIRHLLRFFQLDMDAFFELSTERMARFNEQVLNADGVIYASVVGRAPETTARLHPLLLASCKLLEQQGEQSDGLVPCRSQRWGEVLAEVEADHWAQVGWSRHFDAPSLYGELLRELQEWER